MPLTRCDPSRPPFPALLCAPQVDDLGFPLSFFYDAVPAPRGLADVVYTAFTMLGSLLATEPEPDDEDIAMQWATHPPTCTCPRFPMPFADFQALSGEQQREHIEALKRRYMEVERPQRFQQYQMVRGGAHLAQRWSGGPPQGHTHWHTAASPQAHTPWCAYLPPAAHTAVCASST